jgi:alpha-methylacyl-CoA racemase
VYETADGEWISVGALEPQFFAELMERTGIEHADLPAQNDRGGWSLLRERLTTLFASRSRAEWVAELEGTDVCFAPVLPMTEAKSHPQIVARSTIIEHDGMDQPAPAPRFSRTTPEIQGPAALPGEHTEAVLADYGFDAGEIAALLEAGAVTRRN